MELLANIIGNVGVFCFLAAYFFMQRGRITHTGLTYLGLNLIGSIFLMISLLVDWNFSAFILEAAWALISMAGIYKYVKVKP